MCEGHLTGAVSISAENSQPVVSVREDGERNGTPRCGAHRVPHCPNPARSQRAKELLGKEEVKKDSPGGIREGH